MDRSGEVQFVDDGGLAAPEDDVVQLGAGRFPRWLTLTVAAAALAAGIGFVLSRGGTTDGGSSASNAIASTSAPQQAQGVGSPFPIGPTAAVDVAVFGGEIYVLQAGRIAAVDPLTRQVIAQASVPGATSATSLRLVADAAHELLWVMTLYTVNTVISEFDARAFTLLHTVRWQQPLVDAATLSGYLYFTSVAGLAVWPLGAPAPHLIAGMSTHRDEVAADPTRQRLLLVDDGRDLSSYRPGGSASAAPPVSAPVMKGDLVVVHGAIWFVGFAVTGTAVVAPVDPSTLRVGHNAGVVVDLGLGAEVAGVGADVLWVRNGSGTGALWCVDAANGKVWTSWAHVPGNVASTSHAGYLATGFALLPLIMGSCPG
jgi:hypothetical protein